MVQFIEQDPLLGLCLFALADIDQYIDRPDYLAGTVAKRCRIWDEGNPGPIGTLGHRFSVTDGTTLFESDCHWALVTGETRPVRMVQSPCDAQFVAADRRGAAIKADWCRRYPNLRPRAFPDRDRNRRPYLSKESQRACFLRDLPDS